MYEIEKNIMIGMVSILNEAATTYHNGNPIISDEQYDERLKDLKQLEEETGCMLTNSPNQKNEIEIIITQPPTHMDECDTVEKLIEFSNGEKLMANIVPKGIDIILKYEKGTLKKMIVGDKCHFKHFKNLPYKIDKEIDFTIRGKAVLEDLKLCFYADNLIDESGEGVCNNLHKAKGLGFDTATFWNAAELNPKTIQSFIDFVFDYAEDDEEIPCDGIVFRYDNFNNKPLRYEGIIYKK